MLFPALTGAFYYTYEARPHVLVLAFTGFALVCWQMMNDQPQSSKWVWSFGFSLLGAFMMHCYAPTLLAPFGITELFVWYSQKRLRRGAWLAMLIPSLLVVPLYLPLMRFFSAFLRGSTVFSQAFPSTWPEMNKFYVFLLGPCISVVVCLALVFAVERLLVRRYSPGKALPFAVLPSQELLLCLLLAALPAFGILLGKVVHGPFFPRYFLSAVAGAAGRWRRWATPAFSWLMLFLFAYTLLALVWHRRSGEAEYLVEPSSGLVLATTPGKPLAGFPASFSTAADRPVLVLEPLEFLFLVHYAPALRPRLYYANKSATELFYRGFESFLPFCSDRYNPPVTDAAALGRFHEFQVYADPDFVNGVPSFLKLGAQITGFETSGQHVFVTFRSPSAAR